MEFDNDWQLVINTAVATELMLMTTFLQARMHSCCCAQLVTAVDLISVITTLARQRCLLLAFVSGMDVEDDRTNMCCMNRTPSGGTGSTCTAARRSWAPWMSS
jgi:hypothetical protein